MPVSVSASAALCRSVPPAVVDSNMPWASILPFSFVTSAPSSPACASKRSAISLRARCRRTRSRDQDAESNACLAAAMAARASASPPSAHWPSTAPFAGLVDTETVPDPTHSPSIQCLAISVIWGSLSNSTGKRFPGSGQLRRQCLAITAAGCCLIPVRGIPA